MNSIFNYQTLEVSLSKTTRTLFITLQQEAINMEVLFELESILAWSTNKVEIKSIVLNSNQSHFSKGHDLQILKRMNYEKLSTFMNKLQKINYSLQCMSQTIICDLGLGAFNIGAELAMACDIRIAERGCAIKLNHTKMGLIPCSGGIAILSKIVGSAHAKNWIMSASLIEENNLTQSGFVFKTYNENSKSECTNEILNDIFDQTEVGRIQTKLGLSENNREHIEQFNKFENKLANAAMVCEDWKSQGDTAQESMPAKHFATSVKLSLVKNQDSL